MAALIFLLLNLAASLFKSKGRLEAENAALRQQLIVLQRKMRGRVQFTNSDRLFFIQLYRWCPSILKVMMIIRPETLVRWHRAGFGRYWRWKSRSAGGRPQIHAELRAFIWRMSVDNRLWGAPHIQPIAAGSPWQNGYVERLIGTIRRDCLDHMIVFGEAHLRRTLGKYAAYYNESRIHRSLDKDAPFHRAIERVGIITSRPVLGGLHHQYCRI